jgi:hypothetical protein
MTMRYARIGGALLVLAAWTAALAACLATIDDSLLDRQSTRRLERAGAMRRRPTPARPRRRDRASTRVPSCSRPRTWPKGGTRTWCRPGAGSSALRRGGPAVVAAAIRTPVLAARVEEAPSWQPSSMCRRARATTSWSAAAAAAVRRRRQRRARRPQLFERGRRRRWLELRRGHHPRSRCRSRRDRGRRLRRQGRSRWGGRQRRARSRGKPGGGRASVFLTRSRDHRRSRAHRPPSER